MRKRGGVAAALEAARVARNELAAERQRAWALERERFRLATELTTAIGCLRMIVNHPSEERNPDGVDQAAHSMQLIARDGLDEIDRRRRRDT